MCTPSQAIHPCRATRKRSGGRGRADPRDRTTGEGSEMERERTGRWAPRRGGGAWQCGQAWSVGCASVREVWVVRDGCPGRRRGKAGQRALVDMARGWDCLGGRERALTGVAEGERGPQSLNASEESGSKQRRDLVAGWLTAVRRVPNLASASAGALIGQPRPTGPSAPSSPRGTRCRHASGQRRGRERPRELLSPVAPGFV